MTDKDDSTTGGLSEPPLTEPEVRRRLPAVQYISSDELESEVIRLSKYAPPYFWIRPGSVSGYHNEHKHGLWAHSLKLSPVIDRLGDSWVKQGHIRDGDIELAHCAAILHDQLKEGQTGGETRSDHDLQMAQRVREQSDLPDPVARAIESHMGSWYDGPKPRPGSIDDLVHTADMLASTDALPIPIPNPVPDELDPYVQGVDVK